MSGSVELDLPNDNYECKLDVVAGQHCAAASLVFGAQSVQVTIVKAKNVNLFHASRLLQD